MKLEKEFFKMGALELGKELLGKILVRRIGNILVKGIIVETESYIGAVDKASHAYNGRRTERTEPLFHEGGIAYVYFIYGMHYCMNVISGKENEGEGVLIRAIEPLNNFEYLSKVRFNKELNELSSSQIKTLTNGPAKLCKAFSIDKSFNYCKLYESDELYIEDGEKIPFNIVETKRVGIDYAEEAVQFPWRFYIEGNKFVSKK